MFGSKFNLGDIGSLMKNATKIQEMMEQAQAELAKLIVTGEAGAGAVVVQMNGRYSIIDVTIDDETARGDKQIMQDLVAAAVNDAVKKVEESSQSRMMDMGNLFGGK